MQMKYFELKLIKVDNWKIVLILLVNLVLIYLQIKFVNNVICNGFFEIPFIVGNEDGIL